jgi:transposase-like protein
MSAKRAPTPDADAADPHGIVPDSFLEQYPEADSIADALRKAEQETTSSNHYRQPRCPREQCRSLKIQLKTGVGERPDEKDTQYRCNECGHHFSQRGESRLAALERRVERHRENRPRRRDRTVGDSEQVTLGEVDDA